MQLWFGKFRIGRDRGKRDIGNHHKSELISFIINIAYPAKLSVKVMSTSVNKRSAVQIRQKLLIPSSRRIVREVEGDDEYENAEVENYI